ncbi:MAG: hypothetical protein JSS66_15255 [Armatimonadetes bacterium]|nr:hypothetical protein [Armatimonadota bacterium]
MRLLGYRPILSALLAVSLSTTALPQNPLEAGFKSPPNSAKPHTWWHWINGNITKAGITADLEAMKRIGLGGAQIFNVDVGVPAGKVPFMSPQWKEAIAHAFKEAKRLDLEICVHNCAGWSSSGGPWVTPDHAMQILTWSETPVRSGSHFSGTLPQPETKLGYYRDIAVYAVRQPQNADYRIPDIRRKAAFERGDRIAPEPTASPAGTAIPQSDVRIIPMASDGRVDFDAKDGDWILIRMGHTPTGKENHPSPQSGLGPECDKMSREAMDQHWSGMMRAALIANGPVGPYGLNNALIDSYEVHSQNWTPKFREEFRARRGYDPLPFLPVTTGRVVKDAATSERFLWDFRRTVCDLFADNYFGYFGQLCRRNGLKFSTEGYGDGSFDNLEACGLADIPMGEFWVYGGMAMETTKLASSAAHTNGKVVVGAESFTADDVQGRFQVEPYGIKALGDKIFTLGINRYIFHRYAHQPWMDLKPGMTMGPWGMHLDRTETWWDQGREWMKYIARCQFMLQSGRFVADFLAFTGEEGPNDLPMLGGNTVPPGYDYDGCDATVLMKSSVENGQIVLPSGMRYRYLLLPGSRWMTAKVIDKIAGLVSAGATVIGTAPEMSPSLSGDDDYVARKAASIWGGSDSPLGEHRFGQGRVIWGQTLARIVEDDKLSPDVEPVGGARPMINWIHRLTPQGDVYFVANPKYRNVRGLVAFRDANGRAPEIWNPETGAIGDALDWKRDGGRSVVNLQFGPAGSCFVVFRRAAASSESRLHVPPSMANQHEPKVEVLSARYEATDGAGGADVTAKVRELLASGDTEIGATNGNFGDPAYNHIKELVVEYTVDGKRQEARVSENGSWTLGSRASEFEVPDYLLQDGKLTAFNRVDVMMGTQGMGSVGHIDAAKATPLTSPWTISFPPGLGAPPRTKMSTLSSLSENADPGVKYFSGSATYSTSFAFGRVLSDKAVYLDLGKVKNFAEVTLNGHRFPTLWKAPFMVDVTKWLKAGENKLTVRVTNLWPNRLIGDEQYPPELKWNGGSPAEWPAWIQEGKPRPKTQRIAFTTWHFFDKNSPLLESGLIGPVVLRSCSVVKAD